MPSNWRTPPSTPPSRSVWNLSSSLERHQRPGIRNWWRRHCGDQKVPPKILSQPHSHLRSRRTQMSMIFHKTIDPRHHLRPVHRGLNGRYGHHHRILLFIKSCKTQNHCDSENKSLSDNLECLRAFAEGKMTRLRPRKSPFACLSLLPKLLVPTLSQKWISIFPKPATRSNKTSPQISEFLSPSLNCRGINVWPGQIWRNSPHL